MRITNVPPQDIVFGITGVHKVLRTAPLATQRPLLCYYVDSIEKHFLSLPCFLTTPTYWGQSTSRHLWISNLRDQCRASYVYGTIPWGDQLATWWQADTIPLPGPMIHSHRSRYLFWVRVGLYYLQKLKQPHYPGMTVCLFHRHRIP